MHTEYVHQRNSLPFSLQTRKVPFFVILGTAFITILIVVDRIAWASICPWLDDEAVNIWLSYSRPIYQLPVGLLSSQGIPNPNGMLLLGTLLSRLPGLWFISSFIGVLQALLLILLCWSWLGKTWNFLIVSALLVSSVVLRAISIEFWNQWFLLYVDILFFVLMARYLQKPTLIKIFLFALIIIFTPSLYLAGINNAIAFFVLFAVLFIKTRSRLEMHVSIPSLCFAVVPLLILLGFTWFQYFRAIKIDELISWLKSSQGFSIRQPVIALATLLGFIGWNLTWILRMIPSIRYFNGYLYPPSINIFIYLHNFILLYQALIFFLTFGFAALTSYKQSKNFRDIFYTRYQTLGQLITYGYAFIILTFTINALLKGPFWINGERNDMTIQFLPFFLIAWFTVPFIVRLPEGFQKLVKTVSISLSVLFVFSNIVAGWQVIQQNHNYQGPIIRGLDVPLNEKTQMVDYIAKDWLSRSSSKEIPIYYEFDVLIPQWYKEAYGFELYSYYPPVYTFGRGYDYQFLRMYGLHDAEEGKRSKLRNEEQAVYIVHYSNHPPMNLSECYQEHKLNRLSVSIRRNDPACSN